jgi:cytochrome P450
VTMTTRSAKRDTQLGGVNVPVNSILNVITGIASRDPEIYPDPDKFDLTRLHARPHMALRGRAPYLPGSTSGAA